MKLRDRIVLGLALLLAVWFVGIPVVRAAFPINGGLAVTGTYNACQSAGGSDTYACTITGLLGTTYTTGAVYVFKADVPTTGASSVNFNAFGAKAIKKVVGGVTTDTADNDIRAGQWVAVVYDGTNMQMMSQIANLPSLAVGGSSGDVQCNSSGSLSGVTQTNGQLLIGNTGNCPTAATLSTGTGIADTYSSSSGGILVKNTAGAITLEGRPTSDTMILKDEFCGGGATSSSIGELTWSLQSIGSTPSVGVSAGTVVGHPCIQRIATAASVTAAQGGTMYLWNAGVGKLFADLKTNTNWDVLWIKRAPAAADMTHGRFRDGFMTAVNTVQTTNFLGLRFDNNASFVDTHWMWTACDGSACSTFDTGVGSTTDTAWHKVRMWSTVSGEAKLQIDGGTVFTMCASGCDLVNTHFPTSDMTVGFQVITNDTTQVSQDFDYFRMVMPGLTR